MNTSEGVFYLTYYGVMNNEENYSDNKGDGRAVIEEMVVQFKYDIVKH